jgi:hypothetical protein
VSGPEQCYRCLLYLRRSAFPGTELCSGLLDQIPVGGRYLPSVWEVVSIWLCWGRKPSSCELSLDETEEVTACLRVGSVGEEMNVTQLPRLL